MQNVVMIKKLILMPSASRFEVIFDCVLTDHCPSPTYFCYSGQLAKMISFAAAKFLEQHLRQAIVIV